MMMSLRVDPLLLNLPVPSLDLHSALNETESVGKGDRLLSPLMGRTKVAIGRAECSLQISTCKSRSHLLLSLQTALQQSPYRELRTVAVLVCEHGVQLEGHVSSYFLKQIAQELALRLAPGCDILNAIEVIYPEHRCPKLLG